MEPGNRESHRRMGPTRHANVQWLWRPSRAALRRDGFKSQFLISLLSMASFNIKFSKWIVLINSVVPTSLLRWDAYHHRLGANPQEFVLHTTGTLTLIFLVLSMAVTPLRKALGLP